MTGSQARTRVVVVLLGAALVVAGVSWGWTQRTSAAEVRPLQVQRGGYQPPAYRFCLGLAQVVDGSQRAAAALERGDGDRLDRAVRAVRDGYAAARDASGEVPGAGSALAGLSAARNRALGSTAAAHAGTGSPQGATADLDALARRAQLQGHDICPFSLVPRELTGD